MSFRKAFAEARKQNKRVFVYSNSLYTTRLANESVQDFDKKFGIFSDPVIKKEAAKMGVDDYKKIISMLPSQSNKFGFVDDNSKNISKPLDYELVRPSFGGYKKEQSIKRTNEKTSGVASVPSYSLFDYLPEMNFNAISDTYEMAKNWIGRHFETDKQDDVPSVSLGDSQINMDAFGTKKIPYKGGYATNYTIDLTDNYSPKFGIISEKEKGQPQAHPEMAGLVGNTFEDFYEPSGFNPSLKRASKMQKGDVPVIAWNKSDSTISAGHFKDFSNGNYLVSETYEVPINFVEKDGKIELAPHNQAMRKVPVTKYGERGQYTSSLPIGVKKGLDGYIDPKEATTFGTLEGGKVLFKVGNKQVLAAGSLADIYNIQKQLKSKFPNQQISAFLLDNGSYNLPIFNDKGLSQENMKGHFNRHRGGGTAIGLFKNSIDNIKKEESQIKNVRKVSTGNYRKDSTGKASVNNLLNIVLHHTGNMSTGDVDNLFTQKGGNSSHYYIDKNGNVRQYGEDSKVMYHAGKSLYNGDTDLNKNSIGIELQGQDKNFTEPQYASVVKLINDLRSKYGKMPVLTHKQIRDAYMKANPNDTDVKKKIDLDDEVFRKINSLLERK